MVNTTLRVETYPINSSNEHMLWSRFLDRIVENAIDLDPEYQREVVWFVGFSFSRSRHKCTTDPHPCRPESKQIGLIDSLLRNYYVPPVIFGTPFLMQS